MTINKNLFLFLLFVGLLSSCSIEKRVHSNGYHIDWNGKPSRLELKDITLTKKHKSFSHFGLSGAVYQENFKAKLPLKLTSFEHPRIILKR